jgi:hypothetical protein
MTCACCAPGHAAAGAQQAHVIAEAEAADIDSSHLGGATVTLSGAHPHDRLDFEGFVLHTEDGRTMIGDTGIEVLGGGYAADKGTLTLSGHATPEIYASVLQSLVLESGDGSGLAAGSRSVSVTLLDSEGAASTPRAVEVVVDEPVPNLGEANANMAAMDSGTTQDLAASDILLLMADGGTDPAHGVAGAWTEQVEAGDTAAAALHPPLDQPAADHIQPIDDFQMDTARPNWS